MPTFIDAFENTLRFVMGNLKDFTLSETISINKMPELERWVLHRLWELDKLVRDSCENFQFHTIYTEIHNFCTIDLSAFYLDIRKDCLYCDTIDNFETKSFANSSK